MKRVWLWLFFGLCFSAFADDEFRAFTDTEGREIKAKIVKVDPRSGTVTVERDNRRRVTVPVDIFSEADQRYIEAWSRLQPFMGNSTFRISVDQDTETENDIKKVAYTICLNNKSELSYKAIRVDYCIHVRVAGYNGRKDSSKRHKGTLSFGKLESRMKKELKTEWAQLVETQMSYQTTVEIPTGINTYSEQTITKYKKATEDKIAGIELMVYGPRIAGEQLVRKFCYPSGIDKKYTWK